MSALTVRTKMPNFAGRIIAAREWRLRNAPQFDAMDRAGLFSDSAGRQASTYARDWRESHRERFDAMDDAGLFSDSHKRPRCPHCGERA